MTKRQAKTASAVPRDAATVMLVRDGAEGLEVFMLLRTLKSEFSAGAYVFPGGGVDAADGLLTGGSLVNGLNDRDASMQLSISSGGLAFWVAVVRECFEEAGVLLARDATGQYVDLTGRNEQRFAGYRDALNTGEMSLAEICIAEQLQLPLDQVHYYAHWITPEGMPKRYDTRFFVCQAPPNQVPLHDGSETVDHCWITPRAALEAGRSGSFKIVPVTRKQLESMLPFGCAKDFVDHAAAKSQIPTIMPIVNWGEDGKPRTVTLPLPEGPEEIDAAGLVP